MWIGGSLLLQFEFSYFCVSHLRHLHLYLHISFSHYLIVRMAFFYWLLLRASIKHAYYIFSNVVSSSKISQKHKLEWFYWFILSKWKSSPCDCLCSVRNILTVRLNLFPTSGGWWCAWEKRMAWWSGRRQGWHIHIITFIMGICQEAQAEAYCSHSCCYRDQTGVYWENGPCRRTLVPLGPAQTWPL